MLRAVPIGLDEANAFVEQWHRHHGPVAGCKFCIAVASAGQIVGRIVGVAICGRPVARAEDDGYTIEVLRLCTDGTPNACSFLYRRAWRAARELGYLRGITRILDSESGASLRGSGWTLAGVSLGRSWNCPSRPRVDKHPLQDKLLYEVRE
jgi:hypothetical protein